jgi:hypothetical protein
MASTPLSPVLILLSSLWCTFIDEVPGTTGAGGELGKYTHSHITCLHTTGKYSNTGPCHHEVNCISFEEPEHVWHLTVAQ